MPPPPSTPLRSSYNRRSAPTTPKTSGPKPTGLSASNSVQDRIKQWQSQGAAAALAPDAVSLLSNPISSIERSDSRESRSQLSQNEPLPEKLESTAKGRSGRVVDRDSRERTREVRSSSTPRKKVMTDDNWKVKVKTKEPRSSNATPRQENRNREQGNDVARAPSPTETAREERRQRMRETRRSRRVDDERLKEIYGTSTPPRTVDPFVPQDDLETQSNVDSDLARRFTPAAKDKAPSYSLDEPDSIRPEDDDGRHRRRSKYAESLGTGPEVSDPRRGIKQRKGSIFNKTREIFSKTEQPPSIGNRLPSIEAWLHEQPDDPFVEEGETPVEIPPPLKPRTRRRVSADAKAQALDDKENTSKETTPPLRRRKRRSRDGEPTLSKPTDATPLTNLDRVQDVPSQSSEELPGALKRRTARTIRPRDRSLGKREKSAEASPASPLHVQSPRSPVSQIVDSYSYHQQKQSKPRPEPDGFPDRSYPQNGNQRLSTIASVETFSGPAPQDQSGGQADGDETWDFLNLGANGLKRRLTTHEDLMSQLSLPVADNSMRKTRSKKRGQPPKSATTTQEVLDGIKEDEAKYIRELRTLVDGVIPVLLQCVLSKSDSVAAAGLFTSAVNGKDATRPIVDMGISLERLRSLHNRIPTANIESFLAWAQSAHKAYSDYLKAWRLGFQDVIVNLAPKDGAALEDGKGMARDQNGDVVNADGKKVDVAYLLKRPLVRVKKLSTSLADLKTIVNKPSADRVAVLYQELTELARKRTQEEQGRLEDEAAANVDVTKARELRTLTVSTGIVVDKSRRVKAKDCFSMTLYHTSGQRVDCRIEIVLRDNQVVASGGGDVLFCEKDETGKWLLFSPIDIQMVSARKGDKPEDLVVMVKSSGRQAWHEMLELKADDVETANEWMDMLGSNPLPPKLVRSQSFLAREEAEKYASEATAKPLSAEALKQINGSDMEIPIGEPSVRGSPKARHASPQRQAVEKPLPKLNFGGGLHKLGQQIWPASNQVPPRKPVSSGSVISSDRSIYSAASTVNSNSSHTPTMSSTSAEPDFGKRSSGPGDNLRSKDTSPERSDNLRTKSSTPSKELPTIPRVRGAADQFPNTAQKGSAIDQWKSTSIGGKDHNALPSRSRKERPLSQGLVTDDIPSPPAHRERPSSMPAAAINITQKDSRALQSLSDNLVISTPSGKSPQQSDTKNQRHSSSPLKHEYAPSAANSEDSDDSEFDVSDLVSEDEDTPTPLVPVNEMRRRSRGPPPQSFRQPSASKAATLAPSDSASQGPYRSVPSVPASEKRKAVAMVCTWSNMGMWLPVNHTGEVCSVIVSPGLVEVFEQGSGQTPSASKNSTPASSRETSLTMQPLVGFELTINVMMHGGTGLDITLRSPPTPNSRVKNAGSTVLFRSSSMAEKEMLYQLLNQARMNNPTMLALMAARAQKERDHPSAVNFALGEPARHSRSGSFGLFGLGRKGNSYRATSGPAPSISGETTESTGSTSRNLLQRLSAGSAFALNRSSILRKPSGTAASSELSGSSSSAPMDSYGHHVPSTSNAAVEGAATVDAMKVRLHVREKHKDKWLDLGAVRLSVLPANDERVFEDTSTSDDILDSIRNSRMRRPLSFLAGNSGSYSSAVGKGGDGSPTTAAQRTASASYRLADYALCKRVVIIGAGSKKDKDKIDPKSTLGKVFLDALLPEAAFERIQRIGIAINVWKEEERIAQAGGVLLGRNTVWCVSFNGERECERVFGMVGRKAVG